MSKSLPTASPGRNRTTADKKRRFRSRPSGCCFPCGKPILMRIFQPAAAAPAASVRRVSTETPPPCQRVFFINPSLFSGAAISQIFETPSLSEDVEKNADATRRMITRRPGKLRTGRTGIKWLIVEKRSRPVNAVSVLENHRNFKRLRLAAPAVGRAPVVISVRSFEAIGRRSRRSRAFRRSAPAGSGAPPNRRPTRTFRTLTNRSIPPKPHRIAPCPRAGSVMPWLTTTGDKGSKRLGPAGGSP